MVNKIPRNFAKQKNILCVEYVGDRVVAWNRELDLEHIIYIIFKGVKDDSFLD